jgi:uncharacterized membrane protein
MPFPICFVNLTIGGGLLHVFFPAQMPPPWQLCVSALIGALAIALWLAHHFGRCEMLPRIPERRRCSRHAA